MALAAKRRRLSQADSHPHVPPPPSLLGGRSAQVSTPLVEPEAKTESNSKTAKTKAKKGQEEVPGGKMKGNSTTTSPSKIWSPSGGKLYSDTLIC